jgi:IclR family KDG regulon transcriptional repressor
VSSAEGPIIRTLRVLEQLCLHGPQTLTDIAERSRLGAPTTLRFLRLMQEAGYVKQTEDRRWSATLLMWRLGAAVIDNHGWLASLNSELREACNALGETVVYATNDDGMTVYLGSAEPRRELSTHVALGGTHPAASTVTGRCILAFSPPDEVDDVMRRVWDGKWKGVRKTRFLADLEQIRTDGYAMGTGDIWDGLWGAAVPVRTHNGDVGGAVGTAIPLGRHPAEPLAVIKVLQRTASQLVAL